MLIKNLIEISKGKNENFTAQKQSKRAASSKHRSLNEIVRRKELERIAHENMDMMKRLN